MSSGSFSKKQAIQILTPLLKLLEFILIPFSVLALFWLKLVRRLGNSRLPLHRQLYRNIGVYPIRDHYYEPLFNFDRLRNSLREDRKLPGIDWNLAGQLQFLKKFNYQQELLAVPHLPTEKLEYNYSNDTFGPGDSEFLYNVIRHLKPRRLYEVGSGNSTLMAVRAIEKNKSENANYTCDHVCIEPYERPWLSQLPIRLERQLVESVDLKLFQQLEAGDILFIDSSHMMRPQGDVLHEYLEILPTLRSGVYVHVHDIFSPKDYLNNWLHEDMKLWNEQYLLEAFLSHNSDFEIVGSLNHLKYAHPEELSQACPVFGKNRASAEPGSFWLRRK